MATAYKPKLYLETTIFNYYSYGKAQQKQHDTRALFERIKAGKYDVYTSDYAYDEYVHRISIEAAEDYCRTHPGVQIVHLDGGGYMFKGADTTQP